jgi:hypothetical protein
MVRVFISGNGLFGAMDDSNPVMFLAKHAVINKISTKRSSQLCGVN